MKIRIPISIVVLLALSTASSPGPAAQTVGRQGTGRSDLPVNQIISPVGLQIELPGMRPQAGF
jgi:hypothetical protein